MEKGPLYLLYADLKAIQQPWELGLATAPSSTAYAVASLPAAIVAGTSFRVKTKIYEDQANTNFLDLTGATTLSMYAIPAGYVGSAILLATGTLTGVTPADGESLFEVDSDKILDAWASYDYVRFYFQFALAASKIQFFLYQDIEVISFTEYDDAEYPESKDVPQTYVDVATDTTWTTVYPGWRIVRINATAANVTLTLHASASTDASGNVSGRLTIVHAKGANNAIVALNAADTGGINGLAGPITLGGLGKCLDLIPNTAGDGWVHFNRDLIIA